MMPIRILIADDHPVFRFGLRTLLTAFKDVEVVGEATTGKQAVELAASLQPDVILLDLNMPELNGIDATREIVQANPGTGVLIITMFDNDSVFAAMRAGARGYVLKEAEGDEMLRAIEAVANCEAFFSPSIAERLIHYFANPAVTTQTSMFPELTKREHEILELIAQGLTNAAISERLFVSPKTVRNQVSSIFAKLQVAGRAEAIIRAREAGLGHNID